MTAGVASAYVVQFVVLSFNRMGVKVSFRCYILDDYVLVAENLWSYWVLSLEVE
jgi:hypothetical protein